MPNHETKEASRSTSNFLIVQKPQHTQGSG